MAVVAAAAVVVTKVRVALEVHLCGEALEALDVERVVDVRGPVCIGKHDDGDDDDDGDAYYSLHDAQQRGAGRLCQQAPRLVASGGHWQPVC